MLITMIIIACIGWVLGVHLPWWGILVLTGIVVIGVYRRNGGLESAPALADLLLYFLVFVMMISGFIYGDTTFVDIGEVIKYLFTGG